MAFMHIVLDGLMAATVIFFVAAAHKAGVVKSVLSFATLFASYIAALMFSPVVAGWLEKMNIVDLFTKNMSSALLEGDKYLPGLANAGDRFLDEFTAMTGTAELLEASLKLVDLLYSKRVLNVISFIIVFFLAATIIRIGVNLLDIAAKLPGIATINRFFGLVFGFLEGVVMCYALCIVISLLLAYTGDPFGVTEAIPETTAFKVFYNNNLLTAFIPWQF